MVVDTLLHSVGKWQIVCLLVSLRYKTWSIRWNWSQLSKLSNALHWGYHRADRLLLETYSWLARYRLRSGLFNVLGLWCWSLMKSARTDKKCFCSCCCTKGNMVLVFLRILCFSVVHADAGTNVVHSHEDSTLMTFVRILYLNSEFWMQTSGWSWKCQFEIQLSHYWTCFQHLQMS